MPGRWRKTNTGSVVIRDNSLDTLREAVQELTPRGKRINRDGHITELAFDEVQSAHGKQLEKLGQLEVGAQLGLRSRFNSRTGNMDQRFILIPERDLTAEELEFVFGDAKDQKRTSSQEYLLRKVRKTQEF